MKKLLIILMLIPIIGFSQLKQNPKPFDFSQLEFKYSEKQQNKLIVCASAILVNFAVSEYAIKTKNDKLFTASKRGFFALSVALPIYMFKGKKNNKK